MGSKTRKRGKKENKKSSGDPGLDPAKIRAKLGMTVQEFAAAIGVRDYTVERWERGESKPSPLAAGAIERLVASRRE
jgi:DNA-binding transcriptional regulator YiaG